MTTTFTKIYIDGHTPILPTGQNYSQFFKAEINENLEQKTVQLKKKEVIKMVTDEYGNKLKGFYLVGFFEKGRKALFSVETQKPFKTDENGQSSGNCFIK